MSDLYMVVTDENNRVTDGSNKGMTEPVAVAECAARNDVAKELGLHVHYKVVEFDRNPEK